MRSVQLLEDNTHPLQEIEQLFEDNMHPLQAEGKAGKEDDGMQASTTAAQEPNRKLVLEANLHSLFQEVNRLMQQRHELQPEVQQLQQQRQQLLMEKQVLEPQVQRLREQVDIQQQLLKLTQQQQREMLQLQLSAPKPAVSQVLQPSTSQQDTMSYQRDGTWLCRICRKEPVEGRDGICGNSSGSSGCRKKVTPQGSFGELVLPVLSEEPGLSLEDCRARVERRAEGLFHRNNEQRVAQLRNAVEYFYERHAGPQTSAPSTHRAALAARDTVDELEAPSTPSSPIDDPAAAGLLQLLAAGIAQDAVR